MASESIFRSQHKVRVGLEDVSKISGNVGIARSKLQKIPTRILLHHLCKISVLNYNEKKSAQFQMTVRKGLLRKSHQEIFDAFDRSTSDTAILVDYLILVQLLELSRQNQNSREDDKPNRKEYLDALGLSFLAMNDVVSFVEADDNNAGYTAKMARSFHFRKSDQIRYALPRAWLIYSLLAPQVAQEDAFLVSDALSNRANFNLEDYYDAIFCIFGLFLRAWR